MDLINLLLERFDWEVLILTSLRILLILVLMWGLMLLARLGLRRLEQRLVRRGQDADESLTEASKRAETLIRLLRQGIRIVIWVVALLIILRELGVDIAPILASAGIVGLAVGFGAQNLVRDVIAGFFIILENQVRLGDVAIINGTGGLVEAINFRTLVLRDLSGTVHVFPNGTITTLSNMTREWSGYVFDIGVAYKEDVDTVIGIIREVGEELAADEHFGALIVEPIEVFGLDNFADSAVVIKGRLKTRPIQQWAVGREFRRRLKYAFDARGIEIPFPHRTLYVNDTDRELLQALAHAGRAQDTEQPRRSD
ncbi:hypothetical protein TspCOW1_07670 [Thiohalobacter sp. COW1]|uniref:mechanosensitive ion channel family protein n=1 Tax=Thiohalobacter sp. COW1 TaxID=2795687 RepID=UPI00191571FC|nr:mechanosensitive ion channel family protein [Thiohalobacter sp. COW1]BCO30664.1 hypothetical protein TspCOW1_07670 [Thiohalobacter sp. COW1]